jgi:hypothetical protein
MRFKNTLPLSLLLGMAAFSASACATDGYRDMKFGASTAVLAQANCTMEEPEEAPVGKMYSCEDFTFASNKTEATLFFVNDKFIRIAIAIPDDDVAKTLETLKQQYGVAAHSSQRCRTWICIPIKRRSLISITIISRCSGPAMKMRRAARR